MYQNFAKMNLRAAGCIILSILAVTVFSKAVPAQTLPSLPADSRVQKGTLGSGVTFYMVTNPSQKGYADIAVIQRDHPLSASPLADDDLEFFGRMGVAPGPEGYLYDVDGSTVFHFRDIPFYKPQVLDSMLLYSFSQVAATRAQQAVVVCGDIDPVEIKKKMDIFSMMVPKMLVKESHMPDYVWESSPAPWVDSHDPYAPIARIDVTYATSRIPFEYMNTAQAIVTDLFGEELSEIVRHRLARNLKDAGIPYGEIGLAAKRSMDYGGDERYTVSVTMPRAKIDPAMRTVAYTLGSLDSWGVTPGEFADAKKVLLPRIMERAARTPTRREDIRRCTANFLYGATLAPAQETLRYFSRKNVADTTETRFFNQFSDALLGQLENLTLNFTGAPDTMDKDDALFYYNLSYLLGSVDTDRKDYSWHSADTSALAYNGPRIKVKSEKVETLSGGVMWTMSNGMKVIFKPLKGSGVFSYALHLNAGLPYVAGLREGEGGYIGDMLSLYDVRGISAPVFRDLLETGGVSMETQVSVNGMTVSGSAPSGKLEFLLKSLIALSTSGKLNSQEFEAYKASHSLMLPSVQDLLYQRLVPGFVYTANRIPGQLGDDTPLKAEKFFQERFCRMQDGVFIISGDLSAGSVKKLLMRYMGGFITDKSPSPRKVVPFRTIDGTITADIDDYPKGIHILMDADYALTAEHYYTAGIGAIALQRFLTEALAPYGYTASVTPNHFAQPQERFQLEINCLPAASEGLPDGKPAADADTALQAIRNAIERASAARIDKTDINAWKALVLDLVKSEMSRPRGYVLALESRYSENKDLTSRYPESIQAVTAEKVTAFLKKLADGGRIEYISR